MANLSNIVVPSNVLTDTNTQTVTNKTISFSSNTLTGVAPLASPTFTGTVTAANVTTTGTATFSGSTSAVASVFTNAAEACTISATAATGTINYDATTQAVLYYTTNASANWTVNIRGNSTTSLNTLMATGQALTVVFMVTNGATAYRPTALTIDGASVTPKWQGGSAPSSGNTNSVDSYAYTVVKTGNAAFTVFAAQTRFA